MSRHDCKYWQYLTKYHYRYCGFCGRRQYDYGDKWKDEIKLEYFVEKYSDKCEHFDIIISAGSFFEYNCYEDWGAKLVFKIGDEVFGPFPNLNAAEYTIDEQRRKKQEKADMDGPRIRDR